jgi:radical SAM protein with 4Fe4S-binding SPASM domain
MKNLRLLLDLRKRLGVNGPIIETVFYRMPENEHEESKFVREWRGVVDHVRVVGDISQSFSEYKQDGVSRVVRTRTCMNLWERMTVFWNGDVTMCCQDVDGDCVLGSLNEQSIKEIWHSRRLLAIKRTHENKRFERIPLCHTCDM